MGNVRDGSVFIRWLFTSSTAFLNPSRTPGKPPPSSAHIFPRSPVIPVSRSPSAIRLTLRSSASIISADPVIIFLMKQNTKMESRSARRCRKPHHRAERQHRKVDQHDFPDRLCGFFLKNPHAPPHSGTCSTIFSTTENLINQAVPPRHIPPTPRKNTDAVCEAPHTRCHTKNRSGTIICPSCKMALQALFPSKTSTPSL